MPAARVGDLHSCPLMPGGPVLPPGQAGVFIESLPAARMGDVCTCAGPPDAITTGSASVFIGGMKAARQTDQTAQGGTITAGASKTYIGHGAGEGDRPECMQSASDSGSATIS